MQENPRINQQDRQKITFHGCANTKEISQQYTPTTHTEAEHCPRFLLGVSIPVSDHQASGQLSDASTPGSCAVESVFLLDVIKGN